MFNSFAKCVVSVSLAIVAGGPCTKSSEAPPLPVSAIMKLLARDMKSLQVESVDLLHHGRNHLVAQVNRDWIFRFPRQAGGLKELLRERQLLRQIAPSTHLEVPYFEVVGYEHPYVAYRMIPGSPLTSEMFDSLALYEKEGLVGDLACFCESLHSALSPADAKALGFREKIWPIGRMKTKLLPVLDLRRAALLERLLEQRQYIEENLSERVLSHADLHGFNLAFDADTKRLVGVFDFTDACLDGRSRDLAELYHINPDIAEMTAVRYLQRIGREESLFEFLSEMRNTYGLRLFSDLLDAFDQSQDSQVDALFAKIDELGELFYPQSVENKSYLESEDEKRVA